MAHQLSPPNPAKLMGSAIEVGMMMAEAQSVIAMRMLGMWGIWSVTPAEDGRMISEKVYAMTKANTDATRVAMNGGSLDEIAAAAIKPIRNKTRANAKRLGKRGLKKG